MGLVQKEIEAAGIPTVSLSPVPDFTFSVGAPRVAGIDYPLGRALGKPGDREGQLAVLRETLKVLTELKEPSIVNLPFQWPDPPRESRGHPKEPPPIVKLIKKKPWLFINMLSGHIPE